MVAAGRGTTTFVPFLAYRNMATHRSSYIIQPGLDS